MKSKGTKEQKIRKLQRSIEKWGDHPHIPSEKIGPKQKALNKLLGTE